MRLERWEISSKKHGSKNVPAFQPGSRLCACLLGVLVADERDQMPRHKGIENARRDNPPPQPRSLLPCSALVVMPS